MRCLRAVCFPGERGWEATGKREGWRPISALENQKLNPTFANRGAEGGTELTQARLNATCASRSRTPRPASRSPPPAGRIPANAMVTARRAWLERSSPRTAAGRVWPVVSASASQGCPRLEDGPGSWLAGAEPAERWISAAPVPAARASARPRPRAVPRSVATCR